MSNLVIGVLGDDLYGVDLMNKAFGPGGPLDDPSADGKHNERPRSLVVGNRHSRQSYAALSDSHYPVVSGCISMERLSWSRTSGDGRRSCSRRR